MDSASQTSASSPPNDPVALQLEPRELPLSLTQIEQRPSPIEWLIRLGLFGVVLFVIARQIGFADPNALVYPLLVYGALAAAYVLASVPAVATHLRLLADEQPLSMALAPLLGLLPIIVYARSTPDFDPTEVLFVGVLVLLPTACAILNTPQLHRSDVPLGLITVALPIFLPFARDAATASGSTGIANDLPPALGALGVGLRVGAFALPVLLLLLTTRDQQSRLNFLFVCAVLSLWYAVEFEAFPTITIVPSIDIGYFQLAVIPLFLYVVTMAGRFDRLGLAFQPTPHSVSVVSTNFALFAVIAVPLGLVTGFLTTAFVGPTVIEGVGRALTIFLLIALPEEILFRGTLLTYAQDTLRWPLPAVIGASALIFGASHLNNPPNVGWYFVLAALAGVFYARTFLVTRNVTAAAVVHAAVNWVWWVLFKG